jgi:hypothetical protein
MIPFYASLLVLLAALLQVAGPPLAMMVPRAAAADTILTVSSITSVQTLSQAQVTRDGPIAGSLYLGLAFDTDPSGVVAEKVKELLLVGYNSLWISINLENLELDHVKRMVSEDQANNSSEQVGSLHKRIVSLTSFLDNVDEFLRDTDYQIIQNVVHININLLNRSDNRAWSSADLERRVDVLNALIRARFDGMLYEHNRAQQEFNISQGIPSVDEFLSIDQKRIFFTLTSSITNPLVNMTQLANRTLMIPDFARFADIVPIINANDTQGDNLVYNKSMPGCPIDRATELPGVRISMTDTTGILALRNCGYLPLFDLDSLSFPQTQDKDDRQKILFDKLVSLSNYNIWTWTGSIQPYSNYRCAVMESNGWHSERCSNQHRALCVSTQNTSSFVLSDIQANYTHSDGACAQLSGPEAPYNFTLPRSVTLNAAIYNQIQELDNTSYPVWIDFNSMQTKDCWVTGGPDSPCPFNSNNNLHNSPTKTQWNRNKVALLTISCVITFALILIILFLRLDHLPIRNNENKWKKLMLKYKNSQYRGVPS